MVFNKFHAFDFFPLLIFFVLGGLFTGGMAYFVQGNAFGFDNVTVIAVTPAFFVGSTLSVIIYLLVSRSQEKLRIAHDNLENEIERRTSELKQSEERFRGIFDHSSTAIVTGDRKGNLVVWNDAFRKMLGYENEELENFSFKDISHPDDLEESREHLGKILHGEIDSFRIEKRWIKKDKSICWGEINVAPLHDTNGNIVGSIANILDITDRKSAERELLSRENQLRDFGASASDFYWEMDEHLRFSYFSEMFEEITGVAHDDLFGKTRQESGNPGAEPTQWQEHLHDLDRHNQFRNFVHPRTKPDGTVIWLSINGKPVFDSDGNFRGYRGTGLDVTEATVAQQKLVDLSSAIDEMSEPVVVFDKEDRFIFTNEAYRQLNKPVIETIQYGLPFEGHIRMIVKKGLAPDAIGREEEWVAQRIKMHESPSGYFELKRQDGTCFLGIEKKLPSGGQVLLLTDISEIKKTQEDLIDAKEGAEIANLSKSEFLSSMSHELRTPMNAILGFAQLLDFNPDEPLTKKQKSSVANILKGGNHLLELIDQVLELNKIEAGKLSVNIDHIPAREVIEECIVMIRERARIEGIEIIDLTTGSDLPLLLTDSTRLRQVFFNLLSNAIKYNRQNGTVTLTCQRPSEDMLRINITDTGMGIPVEKQDDLFKPFERLGWETGEIEGTGIGLTITKQIIELLGGKIGFESSWNKGSTFWVDVPISNKQFPIETKPMEATTSLKQPEQEDNGYGVRTILYIEDNPDNMSLMEQIVDQVSNAKLLTAFNAELGLDLARSENPDLILMDINLPGMNGIEALKYLQEIDETKNIPVIAISASVMPKEIEVGKKAGFTAFITKPINVPDMIQTLEKNLNGSKDSD